MHVKMILFAFLALLFGHVDSGNPYNVPPDILSKYRESTSVKCPDLTNGNWEYISHLIMRGSCSQGSAAIGHVDVSARKPGDSQGPPGCWMHEGAWGLAYQKRTTEQVGAMAYHRCSSTYKCIW